MRRPGMWLATGALVLGAVLLGAAGCGGSSSSSGQHRHRLQRRGAPGRGAEGGLVRRDRLRRPGAGLLSVLLADRVRDLREAPQLPRQARSGGLRAPARGCERHAADLERRPDLHVHRASRQVQVQHRRVRDGADVRRHADARPQPQAALAAGGIRQHHQLVDRGRRELERQGDDPGHPGEWRQADHQADQAERHARARDGHAVHVRRPEEHPDQRPRVSTRSPARGRTTSPATRPTSRWC